MSATLPQLETALRGAAFDRAHLGVYADALLASGDPRGELIVVDLELDARPGDDSLVRRRRELLAALPEHPAVTCRYGFVSIAATSDVEVIDRVLMGPFGPFVRDLTIAGPAKTHVRCVVETLVLAPRPWLERLAIRQSDYGDVNLPRAATTALVDAAPHLAAIDIVGRRVFPLVPMPAVRTLVVEPQTALAALVAPDAAMPCLPNVAAIDLRLGFGYAAPPISPLLPPAHLPALRRLDLSRTQQVPAGADLFRIVADLAILPQLVALRVPSVLFAEQARLLKQALDRMPNLTELEVVGSYQPRHIRLYHQAAITLPLL